jgi:hypothetical protein
MGNITLNNKTTVLSYTNPYLFRSTVQCNVPSEDKSRRFAGRKASRHVKVKVKVNKPCTGPEGSRNLRLLDFETVCTCR